MPRDFDAASDAPSSDHPEDVVALRAELLRADFTVDGVRAFLGEEPSSALGRDESTPARLRVAKALADHTELADHADMADDAELAALIGLFLLGDPAPVDALTPSLADLLVRLRLAKNEDENLRATVDLRPHEVIGGHESREAAEPSALWVAADLGSLQTGEPLRRDHVLGIGQASLTLAQFADRGPVKRALDLGTGCGIQTLHLLRHAQHVTATDISHRALAMTRFNLLLNAPTLGLEPNDLDARVSLRLGSMLEPVASERFDLIVSNPPFVITPRQASETAQDRYTYRDGDRRGDALMAELVRDLPDHLEPGGQAYLLGNWEIGSGHDWKQTLRAHWFADHDDVDHWVIEREWQSPGEYAEVWLRDAGARSDPDPIEYRRQYELYLTDFDSRDVERVGFGMVWLRRRSLASEDGQFPMHRLEELTQQIERPVAAAISAAVARHDALEAAVHGGGLATLKPVVAPDVTEERYAPPGAEHPTIIMLRQGSGLRRSRQVSSELAGLVGACDGELTLGQIIGALETILEPDDPEFAHRLEAEARDAIEDGFLLI